jgi:two-component system, chemotaxis family, protein-glutamate methylesterase/glutaminase
MEAPTILVVDDTRTNLDLVTGILEAEGFRTLTASDGATARDLSRAQQPDLILLDVLMPGETGFETCAKLKSDVATADIPIIFLSSLTVRGGEMTVRALELGAFDFVTKPEGGSAQANLGQLRASLLPMIMAFERRHEIRALLRGDGKGAAPPVSASISAAPPAGPPRTVRVLRRSGAPLVLIGVSTGGPCALATLLPALPADLGAPVFIVQHMPSTFTQPLAASLDKKSAIRVKEAQDGEAAQANCAYVAPGGRQMKLFPGPKGEVMVAITDDPPENGCRPAVDYLFRSAALHFPGRSVAAILTGMGNDGTAGLRMLKRSGCFSIAQDEASCVVFGMPKEAIQAGVVDTVTPLNNVGAAIVRWLREVKA